ncbi:MAG: monovalent cation/H+ antiporter complex subunit F [Microthrixaceae bacterium]
MNSVITICQIIVSIGALLCVVRLVVGPSLPDRALALDTLLMTIVVEVALGAAKSGTDRNLDMLLVVGLVAFIGTTAVGRFVERRGAR